MVLTVSFALSRVTGLCCHPRPQESLLLENLTPASGRQDHTTSPSARKARSSMRSSRPPHPAPTSVTIAKRPSVWDGTVRDMQVIWLRRERKYFCGGGLDRANQLDASRQIGFSAQICDTSSRPRRVVIPLNKL